jgi:polyhydroxyalkanoate synthesis regulator phasin
MMNSIRRALLAGVGAAIITKEKAEETLNDFVQQGRVSAKDAKVMARQLAKDGRKEFQSVRSDVEDKLLDLAKQAGTQAQARIAALEA